jgi:hypothetical protein
MRIYKARRHPGHDAKTLALWQSPTSNGTWRWHARRWIHSTPSLRQFEPVSRSIMVLAQMSTM